ncbi:hypothetical protein AX14_002955 [Amanita brunnescens Koide BX004]|nr:hypothetical protein AX14_002955 [Amanita brunnescens Koide BX004]
MPAFLPLRVGKRKQDATSEDSANPKRQAPATAVDNGYTNSEVRELHWMVQWRKPQYKKHKTWDGDGVLVVKGSRTELYDLDGKLISSGKTPSVLSQENVFSIGDKEVEFDRVLSPDEYSSGACFTSSSNRPSFPAASKINKNPFVSLVPSNPTSNLVQTPPVSRAIAQPTAACRFWRAELHRLQGTSKIMPNTVYIQLSESNVMIMSEDGTCVSMIEWDGNDLRCGQRFHTEIGQVEVTCPVEALEAPWLNDKTSITLAQGSSTATKQNPFLPKQHKKFKPLHDPNAPGAVVMKGPNSDQQEGVINQEAHVIPVVLDPVLINRMRPHQIEGVKFMYESVMGLRKHEGSGCILADEMGLGKSLQTIGLIWTMLKQSPYPGHVSSAKKVLLVCPVTLINNWKAEFYKWMGRDRINVVVCDKDVQVAQMFANVKAQQVLITGYERLRTITKYLSFCMPPIDLIICDEGHRLKSSSNKTRETFNAFRTQRRIILSGTPIQNDLREFHAMVDFCNPGLLDDYSAFRRTYEVPILRGRAPDASAREAEVGKLRSAQLHAIAKSFVLRRDISVLQGKLPPKHEYVVFVVPTSLQLALYESILRPEKIDDLVECSRTESLPMINILVKISNSPVLLKATFDKSRAKISTGMVNDAFNQLLPLLPKETDIGDVTLSGKLTALSRLLQLLRQTTDEKCVIVSHYTSTLNILEVYCKRNRYSFLRLDGQTPASKRQEYVIEFNKASQETCFLFLLSSKAGMLNLHDHRTFSASKYFKGALV